MIEGATAFRPNGSGSSKAENRAEALNPLSIAQLRALELPERRRVLPWLAEGGLVMVYGPRGVGKTYFTLSLAVALSSGEPFLRWPAATPVGVMLIDGEMALAELRDRLRDLLPGEPTAPLEIVSHEWVYEKTERDLNLGVADWQLAINDYVDSHPEIRVLILDNLACLLPTVAEDKRDEWSNRVLPFLIGLRRRGLAVVMVHHAGKGGDQRGTSSREDTLNTVIRLDRLADHDATQGAQFVVRFTKSRGAYGDDVADFEARLETDACGRPCWTWKPIELSNEDRLMQMVRDGIGTVTEAAEEMGLSKGAVSKIKKRLVAKGLLKPGAALELA